MIEKKEFGLVYFDEGHKAWIVHSHACFEKAILVGDLIYYGHRWAYPAIYGTTKSGFPRLYDYIDIELAKKLVDGGFIMYHKEYNYTEGKLYGVREV